MKSKKYIASLLILFSLSVSQIIAETTYTFEYGNAPKIATKSFTLTARNMHRTFVNNDMSANNYVAGFIIQNKTDKTNIKCKIWKSNAGKYCWTDAAADEKEMLLNLRDVSYGNKVEINSTDSECRIDKFYYIESAFNSGNLKVYGGSREFYIYDDYNSNSETGTFVFAVERNRYHEIMSFECYDNCQYAEKKGNITPAKFASWLKAEKNFPLTGNDKYYEIILSLLYDSIKNDPNKNLYSLTNKYMTEYLNIASTANVNLYGTEIYYENKKNYIPSNYEMINSSDAEKIAVAAKKLTTDAIDYLDDKVKKNYPDFKYPVAYCEYGVDSPATFNRKISMSISNKFNGIVSFKHNFYRPGTNGSNSNVAGAGCDNYGMLTYALHEAGVAERIKIFHPISTVMPVKEYNNYANSFLTIPLQSNSKLEDYNHKYRIQKADLNSVTVIVPSADKLQKGDIIDNCNGDLGIITDDSASTKEYTKVKFVWMNKKKGYAEETTLDTEGCNFTNDKSRILLRRILLYKNYNIASKYTVPVWDVLDTEPVAESVSTSITKMREETQRSPEKYRWIPNTGEHLVLSGIHMSVYNKAGILLKGNNYKVKFSGAVDRNYVGTDSDKTKNGNINTNTDCKFEIIIYNATQNKKGSLVQNASNKKNYDFVISGDNPEFKIGNGGLLYYNNSQLKIGIRPENASKAHPGDDLLLTFNGTYKDTDFAPSTVVDSSYIAVYDKKMLWRANLYIDIKENVLGNLDWNEAHPWNAPPDSTIAISKAPEWWDAVTQNGNTLSTDQRWGFNEWNRSLKVEDYKENVFKGLNTLTVGNGGQVTDFVSFTPLRPIAGTMAAPDKNKNVISNTVAYNFPDHAKEEGTGDAGSMDSPFDFNKKMLVQQLQLNKWYDANGVKKETAGTEYDSSSYGELNAPSNSWYHYELSTTSNFKYDEYEAAFIPGIGNFIKYGVGYAQNVLLSGETGDKEQIKKNFAGNDLKGKNGVYEAGTDCVGFANRAASYNDSIYKWTKTQPGWTEYKNGTGTNNLKLTHNNYSRTYPRTAKDKYSNGVSVGESGKVAVNIFTTRGGGYDSSAYVNLNEQGLLDSRDLEDKKQLLKIVPGDIFVKCSSDPSKTNDEMDSHIAIVASVPSNAEELTVGELLDSIILIEAEISWRVQSVIKTFSLGDYGKNKLTSDNLKTIYKDANDFEQSADNSSVDNTNDPWNLKNRHYAIRRLICNEIK